MGACKGITMGSIYDCENPLKASVAERLLIGNLDDIEDIIYNTTNTSVIEDIIMKPGTAMYAFEGVRSSNKPQVDLIADDVSVGFSHQIDFSVFEVDSDQKVNLQGMSARKTFAIYQNPKDSSLGDSVWEVLGANSGLEMSTLLRQPASKDGSYKIQLKTPESASETGLPNSFWDTDITTTQAVIDSLFSGGALVLTSGTVETALPTEIVLTFEDAAGAPATITSFGSITVGGTPNTFVGASILANVVTVVVGTPYIAADPIELSGNFNSANGVLTLKNEIITNNVV